MTGFVIFLLGLQWVALGSASFVVWAVTAVVIKCLNALEKFYERFK